jgi:hypothetical protein
MGWNELPVTSSSRTVRRSESISGRSEGIDSLTLSTSLLAIATTGIFVVFAGDVV